MDYRLVNKTDQDSFGDTRRQYSVEVDGQIIGHVYTPSVQRHTEGWYALNAEAEFGGIFTHLAIGSHDGGYVRRLDAVQAVITHHAFTEAQMVKEVAPYPHPLSFAALDVVDAVNEGEDPRPAVERFNTFYTAEWRETLAPEIEAYGRAEDEMVLGEILDEVLAYWPNADLHQGVWTIWAEDTTKYVLASVEGGKLLVGRYTSQSDEPVDQVAVTSVEELDAALDEAVTWAYSHEENLLCLSCNHLASAHEDTADAFCRICGCEGLHLDVGDCTDECRR